MVNILLKSQTASLSFLSFFPWSESKCGTVTERTQTAGGQTLIWSENSHWPLLAKITVTFVYVTAWGKRPHKSVKHCERGWPPTFTDWPKPSIQIKPQGQILRLIAFRFTNLNNASVCFFCCTYSLHPHKACGFQRSVPIGQKHYKLNLFIILNVPPRQ